MSLTSPFTLLVAWGLAPALVVLLSAGLGHGLRLVCDLRMGALLVPAGFLAGTVVVQFGLNLGFDATLTVGLLVALAATGPLAVVLRHPRAQWRSQRGSVFAPPEETDGADEALITEPERGGRRRLVGWRAALWPAAAALAAFAVAMAPLAGAGRAGILGYVLSNDSAVHISTVELLHDIGLHIPKTYDSSYAVTASQFGGYPLGALAWPLIGREILGVDTFFIWSPLIAVTAAMTALLGYGVLRTLDASAPIAAVGGATVACGYFPFSYLTQGNLKEAALAIAVVGAVVLFAQALEQRVTARRLLPAGFAIAAAIAIFGLGAAAFLAPVGLLAVALAVVWAPRGRRLHTAGALAFGAAAALVLTAPFLASAFDFVEQTGAAVRDPNASGNLLAPVPWREAFGVWLGGDYRYPVPEEANVTNAGIALAAALGVVGVAFAVLRRRPAVPLALLAASTGAILICRSASIYFDAKTYVVLAIGLGLATAAGVAALCSTRRLRWLGLGAGAALVLLVAASDLAVYRQAWVTPEQRFQELIDLGERYAAEGPTLFVEREDYGRYFLRNAKPWESWGSWYTDRGLKQGPIPPLPPHAPDFDDYRLDFFKRFRLLVERKRPGGSLPPSGFTPVEETPHYRVWRRSGPLPRAHVAVGVDTVEGTARLDCGQPTVQSVLDDARVREEPVRYAERPARVVLSPPTAWLIYSDYEPGAQKPYIIRRGGFAVAKPHLPAGRYEAWIQGSFANGVRLYNEGTQVGEVFGDLGQHDQWHRLGTFTLTRADPLIGLVALDKPAWQSGSRRPDITGEIAYVARPTGQRVREIAGRDAARLCGRNLDWIELP